MGAVFQYGAYQTKYYGLPTERPQPPFPAILSLKYLYLHGTATHHRSLEHYPSGSDR